ncbi:hypothetical protein [Streptomyces sp. NBC_00328]|uniref:hypothetical protein n=1 Tax=Streptomyces sp. NBC_00328 TaxID=2903646 RepID=UPI002E29849E|nr:hypothetical protein [Streptomyces sp. NBC_00328]
MTAVVGDLGGAGFAAAPGVVNQYTRERAVQSGPLGGFRSPGQRFAQKAVPETAFAGPGLREQSGPGRLPEQRTHLVEGHGGGVGEHVEPEPCPQQGGEVQQQRGTGRQFGGTGADRVADPDGHGGRRGLGTGPFESAARPEELGHEERVTARVPGQGVRGRRLGSAVRRGVEQGRDVLMAVLVGPCGRPVFAPTQSVGRRHAGREASGPARGGCGSFGLPWSWSWPGSSAVRSGGRDGRRPRRRQWRRGGVFVARVRPS